ncbi:hypothetical protein GCM10008904_01160 [Paraclostridium ghonii]|uniref:DUF1700 domain-containing protein n=1 Tax=Paraclostridium ghonii TaxID=29358 RepID=A0ABU0N431_9FIRM|nr:permease prefix domain 1-containing protein [Paeniclostridium ghonii]MDQ0557926.1 hypothetical protein [Paeniclostridium ghonii]
MTTEKNSIENFLQSVCRFICAEERAQDIRDELKDHIDSYIDEYTNDGMTIEDATSKALKQMGDPYALSSTFKDKIYKKNRLFIASLIVFFMLILLSINIYAYMNNFYTFIDFWIDISFIICSIPLIIILIKTFKKSQKLYKTDPLFYIQTCKESSLYEKGLKCFELIFIFSILINIVPDLKAFNFIPTNKITLETLSTIAILIMDLSIVIILYYLGPKKTKNIVYTEGILTFDSFIPWDNIVGYRWVKEHSKNKVIYSIELKLKKKSSYSYLSRRQLIKVSSYQINLVDEIFKTNNIEHRQCF